MMREAALKDIAKLLSGSLLAKAFGMIALMLFARILSKGQMAVFPVYLMLAGIANLILTCGIFSTFMREIPSLLRTDETRMRSLVMTGSGVVVAGTTIASLAAFWWSGAIAEFVFRSAAQAWMIRIMVLGFLAFVVSRIAEYVMWGRGQFGATSTIQILESIVRPGTTIALYFWLGYPGIVIGLVAAQFIMASFGFWYVRDVFFGPLPHLYPVRKLISESMPYYVGNYLTFLRGDGDALLVTAFLGPVALAEYYVAKTLYTNMSLILTAVDKVAVERLARFVGTPAFLDRVKSLHVRISQTLIPFGLLAIAIAPGSMFALAGARYGNAIWPAILLLVVVLVQFVAIPIDRAVFLGVPGFLRVAYAAVEAAAVLGTIALLAPLAGITGVAAARIVAPVGFLFFGLTILRKRLGLVLPFKATFLALATALPGTLLALLIAPPAHGVAGALGGIALAVLVWTSSFLLVAYFLNRPLLDRLTTDALREYRAVFSA